MKNCGILVLFFSVLSCNFVRPEKDIKEKLIASEKQHINWNDLDQYPLFERCDETAGKSDRKTCFETTLTQHLEAILQQHEIVVHESISDTVWLQLRIDNQGKITILGIEKKQKTVVAIPQLDHILNTGVAALPKLHPPLKRDIPVAAKFKLPIVVYVE